MDDVKTQLANRLKEANNVLVSVSNNPSVDQFAAAIGLTLMLNKLGKHATTVFSGTIPSLVEFLQPEKVVEKNTDSLRDFIISLDKSKADKLRYKIEDNFVKIFITPYHSSIGQKDLVFSQGDFNVDVIVGLGIHNKEELDQAIVAHGRILHDATVTTINTQQISTLGTINWAEKTSSSICEMLVGLSDILAKQGLLDAQISNALLTGIVAETQRFSNKKTTSATMSYSSKLLAAGANQQLVATQLTPKPAPPPPPKPPQAQPHAPEHTPPPPAPPLGAIKPPTGGPIPNQVVSEEKPDNRNSEFGVLEIAHDEDGAPDVSLEDQQPKVAQVSIDDQGTLKTIEPDKPSDDSKDSEDHKDEHPNQDANNQPHNDQAVSPPPPQPAQENTHPVVQPLSPMGNSSVQPSTEDIEQNRQQQVMEPPPTDAQLSSEGFGNIADGNFTEHDTKENEDVSQPISSFPLMNHGAESSSDNHIVTQPPKDQTTQQNNQSNDANLSEVRSAVDNALASSPPSVANQPIAALNSQEVDLNLNPMSNSPVENSVVQNNSQSVSSNSPVQPPPISTNQDPASAPPVPPPIVPINNDTNLPPSYNAL